MNNLEEAIRNHEPIIVNYGKGKITKNEIKEITFYNNDKDKYISETGEWDTNLLIDIARGKVEDISIELMQDV